MPTRNSKPELLIRTQLHAKGLRYRLHRKDLPGKPDIVFGPSKVAVFVDGCFWHNCPEHGTIPKNNREWWKEKFQRNRERDIRKDRQLKEMGWLPIHVWEHEDPDTAARNIDQLVKERLN
jgi:DNA mismatch endonuclease (patch repair protein)